MPEAVVQRAPPEENRGGRSRYVTAGVGLPQCAPCGAVERRMEDTMGALRDKMQQDLELGGYAAVTKKVYLSAAADFARHFGRSPARMGQDEVRAYIRYLVEHKQLKSQRLRQHMAGLKFLYARTLGRPEVVSFLSWPSDPARLPVMLSAEEVTRLLVELELPVYRVLFTTVYATGLRISEACLLGTGDIDASRGVIHVRNTKGGKERLVMLSPRLLKVLRAYWVMERPVAPYLFTLRFNGMRIPAKWNTRFGRSGTPVPEQAEQSERQRRWPGFTSPPSWTGSNSFPGRAPSRP